MATIETTPAGNYAISAAKDITSLKSNLEVADPELAKQLETKPLLAAKTPYGTVLTTLVAMAAAKYGIGLDNTTDQLISGSMIMVATWIVSLILRKVTSQKISGVVSSPTVSSPTKNG